MKQIQPGGPPRLPMTSQSLASTLEQRFGARIRCAVLAAIDVSFADGPLGFDVVERAITMALDAELMGAGASFSRHASMSALGDTAAFRRAAELVGFAMEGLDIEQRLRIDAAFAGKWRSQAGERRSADDKLLARSVMVEVLLSKIQ